MARVLRAFQAPKCLILFIITTICFLYLLPDNSTRNISLPVLDCTGVNLSKYLQESINQPMEIFQHPGVEYIPELINPCWYEKFSQYDLDMMKSNPYHITYLHKHNISSFGTFENNIQRFVDHYSRMLHRNKAARLRCIPSVYIIGQPKCASSDFYDTINLHPQIKGGLVKESQWWAWTSRGIANKSTANETEMVPLELSDFADLFSDVSIRLQGQLEEACHVPDTCSQQLISDGSVYTLTSAFRSQDTGSQRGMVLQEPTLTPDYLKWLVPNAKLILLIREPGDRLYSAYKYFITKSKRLQLDRYKDMIVSPSEFHRRVTEYIEHFEDCIKLMPIHLCIGTKALRQGQEMHIADSLYSYYLEEWMKVFGPEDILVIRTEDYQQHRLQTLKKTFRFLGVCDVSPELEDKLSKDNHINEGRIDIGPMLNQTRQLLNTFFQPYNQRLAQLLNDSRFLWKDYHSAL